MVCYDSISNELKLQNINIQHIYSQNETMQRFLVIREIILSKSYMIHSIKLNHIPKLISDTGFFSDSCTSTIYTTWKDAVRDSAINL